MGQGMSHSRHPAETPPAHGECLLLDRLDDDTVQLIAALLKPQEVMRFCMCNRYMWRLLQEPGFVEMYARRYDVTLPPDCHNPLRHIYNMKNFVFDPARTHPYLRLAPDHRSAEHVTEESRSGYFCATMGLQEVPKKGTHRYTVEFRSAIGRPSSQWGAIAVAGAGYNIESNMATFPKMSEGWWESNEGIGYYSQASCFQYGASHTALAPIPLDRPVSVEVNREQGRVRFLAEDTLLSEVQRKEIHTARYWPVFLLMQKGLSVHIVGVTHEGGD